MQGVPDESGEREPGPVVRPVQPAARGWVDGAPVVSFDTLYIQRPRAWLAAILAAYLLAAFSFALNTPPWQTPDEPAHYNYIAHIATQGSLPVLQMDDYDQALLDRLLSAHFGAADPGTPADVASLRYESHQPPLYYVLATPIYWVSGGSLLALRIFGVVIGAATIVLLYLCLELVFPTKTLIVVGATAFAALLPMHVAMLAAVNNDGLAELLVVASMLVTLSWMRCRFYASGIRGEDTGREAFCVFSEERRLVWLGILLGLGMLTKIYAYVLAPILLLTIVMVVWRNPTPKSRDHAEDTRPGWRTLREGVRLSLWAAIPALLLGAVWWVRNYTVYGGWDLLGLVQHGRVVAEQPRTIDWIADKGWMTYWERAFSFTFQSFWGVFGWMGVFMDQRIYTAFLLFTGVIFLGVLWAVVRMISGRPDADMDLSQLWALGLFGVMIVAVGLAYIWYNAEFMQHQGRYFFWGLLPISTIVALGWREVMQPLQGLITAALSLAVVAGVTLVGYVIGAPNKWTLLTACLIALALLLQPLLLAGTSRGTMRRLPGSVQQWLQRPAVVSFTRWARVGVWALPFVLMWLLNLLIPHTFIIPQLTS